MITQSRLKELLEYNPDTGEFRWRVHRMRRPMGSLAGSAPSHNKGYVCIIIDGKKYKAHRLAWLYMTGAWPSDQIDHKNLIKSDNKFNNLREATNGQNCINRNVYGASGIKGVYWHKPSKKWKAQIKRNKICKVIGYFSIKEEAAAAYREAALKSDQEFLR